MLKVTKKHHKSTIKIVNMSLGPQIITEVPNIKVSFNLCLSKYFFKILCLGLI